MPRYHNINGNIVQFTAEEEAARDAEEKAWADGALARAQANLRSKRNRLLAETDFYALSDVTMSDDMKTYRQELRDLPADKDTVEKCNNATFPTKP
jgi:TPP-dependent pyruvate/acetoin dehydrogenase alpha subunit|tara:strand:+ start:1053 stop:1340 length:288 start_codon:yes stop_codon:yes gene_type:complete